MADTPTETPAPTEAPAPKPAASSSTSRSNPVQGSGTIVALMGITVLFSLIGNELKNTPSTPGADKLTTGGKIILGGAVATTALTLLSHAGNAGRQFSVGLASVAMVTSTLVYGGPVWTALSKLFGSKPTGSTGGTVGTVGSDVSLATGVTDPTTATAPAVAQTIAT